MAQEFASDRYDTMTYRRCGQKRGFVSPPTFSGAVLCKP
jgi:hypothetical protein